MGLWISDVMFVCNLPFIPITALLIEQLNLIEDYEISHRTLIEDGYECDSDSTDFNNLMTALLQDMGKIALLYPFNRAVYPLPSGDAIDVPT